MDIKKNYNKKAFTLAEIMIALLIIGVIAIVTLPSMLNSIQTRQYKSGVKKAHTVVAESFDSMKVDENYIYKLYNNNNVDAVAFRNMYAKYFGFVDRQGQVIADVLRKPDELGADYYPLNDTSTKVDANLHNGGGFLARNGMLVMVGKIPKPYDSTSTALIISVDVDGPKKGENQLGRDVFSFEVIPSDNILPVGANTTKERNSSNLNSSTSFDYATYCNTDTAGGNNLNGIACAFSAIHSAEYMNTLGDRNGGQNCDGQWVKDTDTCQCRNGKNWNKEAKKCECPSGYTENNGLCYDSTDSNCIYTKNHTSSCCTYDCGNQHFNSDKGEWECNNGTFNTELNRCTGCSAGTAITVNGETVCCPNGKDGEDKCECSDGYTWVSGVKKCVQDCVNKEQKLNKDGICECPSGTTKLLGNASICCANTDKHGLTLKNSDNATECSYDCGEGRYEKGECNCGSGIAWNPTDKKCKCQDHHATWSSANGGECVCNNGRHKNNGACLCDNGSAADDCGCEAAKGLVAGKQAGSCICDNTKGFSNQKDNEGNCKCADSLRINSNGVCVCDNTKHRINVFGKCECDVANHWVVNGNQCECPVSKGFEIVGNECKCQGDIQSDGSCSRTCKDGATLKPGSSTECECKIGQYSSLNSKGDRCECEGGLWPIQNTTNGSYSCRCPQGQIQDGTNCTGSGGNSCNGIGKYLDEASQKCECADGLVRGSEVDCKCPSGWIQNEVLGTSTGYIGTSSFTRIYCMPDPLQGNDLCQCSTCQWTSTGGAEGSCYCGAGLQFNETNQTCSCYGTDVTTTEKTETTDDDKEVTSFVCNCATDKLTYQEKNSIFDCYPNGTDDKYEISSSDDLKNAVPLMGTYNFKLTTDINVEDKWTPFGTPDKPFKGEFDGNGHIIEVKDICAEYDNEGNCVPADYTGFFGKTQEGCKISNLTIKVTGEVKGLNYVGAAIGYNNCVIENVKVEGDSATVTGEDIVGGFVGYNASSIYYSSTDGITTLGNEYFGGFAGENASIISTSSVGSASIIGVSDKSRGKYAGGFVGKMTEDGGSISNCYVQAQYVYANTYAAGFIGYSERGTMSKTYTIADASANTDANGYVAQYSTTKSPTIISSFYKSNSSETHTVFNQLYGRTLTDLKDPGTYLCTGWNDEPCYWAYDVNKTKYPVLLTKDGKSRCEDMSCYYSNEFYTSDNFCQYYKKTTEEGICNIIYCNEEANIHLNSSDECITCYGTQFWDSNEEKCTCGAFATVTETGCECEENSGFYEGVGCVFCTADATLQDNKCSCNDTSKIFDSDLGKCIPDCIAQGKVYDDESGTCIEDTNVTSNYSNNQNEFICKADWLTSI